MSMRLRAILMMILSAISFAVMAAAVKFLQTEVPLSVKVLARNSVSLLVAYLLAHHAGAPLLGSSKRGVLLLFWRSLFGLVGVALLFYSLAYLPLADASIYMQLSPFWVMLLAALFLHEKLRTLQVFSAFLALLGACLVFRPFSASSSAPFWPVVAALVQALFAGIAYIFVSKLKNYEKPETIVFFFSLFSVIAMLPFTLRTGFIPTGYDLVVLFIVGLAAASGQIFLTYSYRLGLASEVSMYSYIGIPVSTLLGFILWQEVPHWWSIGGALLIFIAGYLVYISRKGTAHAH